MNFKLNMNVINAILLIATVVSTAANAAPLPDGAFLGQIAGIPLPESPVSTTKDDTLVKG
ncbi:hypothetical protein BGZ91_008717, partial [Linnemannia elongata]